jgi:two-component system response regulator MprA
MENYRDSLFGKRVLVIDDSTLITSLIGEVFSLSGSQVQAVNSGAEALCLLQEGQYDLVILDVIMPHISGWDVLKYIRDYRFELLPHVLLLTGDRYHQKTVDRIYGTHLTAMYKPFEIEDLRVKAREILSEHKEVSAN